MPNLDFYKMAHHLPREELERRRQITTTVLFPTRIGIGKEMNFSRRRDDSAFYDVKMTTSYELSIPRESDISHIWFRAPLHLRS